MRIIRNYLFFEEQEEDLQHVQAPLALQDRLRQEGGREGGRTLPLMGHSPETLADRQFH